MPVAETLSKPGEVIRNTPTERQESRDDDYPANECWNLYAEETRKLSADNFGTVADEA